MTIIASVLIAMLASPAVVQNLPLTERMLLAEDSRAQTDAELAPLRDGLRNRDPKVRRQAARAIGRLEKAELIPLLTPTLNDADADVRIEAANAVGQLARGPQGVTDAKNRLLARTRIEREPRVWGAVAATLGRIPYTTAADVQQVETAIARVLPTPTSSAVRLDEVLGAVEGLESLARQSGKISRLSGPTLTGLRAASELEGRAQDAEKLTRIRRLASLALMASGGAGKPELDAGIADPDDEVRRLAMVAARNDVEGREAAVTKGLADVNPRVRFEALQTYGRAFQKASCDPVLAAVRDPNPHVSLLAIDLLGNGCPAAQSSTGTLQTLTEVLTELPYSWHAPAHALVALAKTSPLEARMALPRYLTHSIWQVRMYAARAAGALAALDELNQLARDTHDNVCEAALGELITLKRPEALTIALDALSRSDYQLGLTATRAIGAAPVAPEGTEQATVGAALLTALARITAEKRETSRDVRMAILGRIAGLPPQPEALRPYLADFDPVVASKTAAILNGWGQTDVVASPRRLPSMPVTLSAVAAIREARLRFTMIGRGAFEMRLLMEEAPVSALRVVSRAREGYYNGLTFHRVVPNFVVQGGSPGANEYMGDGPYMRDEVGLVSHRRGTVGISTRGRDTGDAQIFINLVDSPRLDHTYTVFAEVTSGMEVVDALLEGDVIEQVEVLSRQIDAGGPR
jgi:cyclophilin family peptidyl-prolyl cis-trans isomerase/HEAT repeat protein